MRLDAYKIGTQFVDRSGEVYTLVEVVKDPRRAYPYIMEDHTAHRYRWHYTVEGQFSVKPCYSDIARVLFKPREPITNDYANSIVPSVARKLSGARVQAYHDLRQIVQNYGLMQVLRWIANLKAVTEIKGSVAYDEDV